NSLVCNAYEIRPGKGDRRFSKKRDGFGWIWKKWKMKQRPKSFVLWSGRWESNPRPKLGKLLYCHCTTPALKIKLANWREGCNAMGRLLYLCSVKSSNTPASSPRT